MGVILDSSILIAAERAGQTVRQILTDIRATQGEIDIGLSVVTMRSSFMVPTARTPRPGSSGGWSLSPSCAGACLCTL